MWHEARKQEKLIRGMIVDYRRRAERRKDFYEKIKAEPTQFLQLHGRPCKIHLDPAVAMAGEGPAIMMQWQGDPENLIDRFDVRAHLDFIPEVKFPDVPVDELSQEERQCNYERYRILAQNAFLGINEDKFLQQLAIEEQFGVTLEEKEMQKEKLHERKGTGAAIGYNYDDPGAQPSSSNGMEKKVEKIEKDKESDDDSDLDILDVDLSIDVNKMEPSQAHDLNAVGPQFGMAGCDLFSFLTGDADDAEHQKQLLREEKEKAMFSGRKSRRERRAHRDKKLASRVMSPPSYAAPASASASAERAPSRSPSRSPSPDGNDNIEFITSFGGEDEEAKPPLPKKQSYSEKVKQNLKKLYSEVAQKKSRSERSEEYYRRPIGPRGPNSRSVSPTTISSESPHSKSRSRSPYNKSRSRSVSRSSSSRSRSRSRSRNNRSRRSRSLSNNCAKRRSRSKSFESTDRAEPAPVPRYYGRRKEDKSSSELSYDSGSSDSEAPKNASVGNKTNTNQNQFRSSGSGSKGPSREAMSLKEKLKKKMQAQLARQLRADKRAEAERQERESRRQARRDEEMRELAIKLRRKQREMRHKYRPSSEESDRSRSRSSSRDSGPPGTSDRVSRSRSKSPTAERPRPPVWDLDPLKSRPKPEDHPPYDRQRYQDSDHEKSYYPENNLRSRSPSPNINRQNKIPVWEHETRRPPPFASYSDSRRRYDDDRQENRQEYRQDNRQDYRQENRQDFRQENRPDYRQENRPDYRQENRPEYRQENRPDYRQENKPDYRQENPRDYHNRSYDSRHEQQTDRWDSKRRPYSQRGGYRGYNNPGPSDDSYSRDNRSDRNKVKLVDY